jgi:FMN phosphatase YigB (HAD superfamily)
MKTVLFDLMERWATRCRCAWPHSAKRSSRWRASALRRTDRRGVRPVGRGDRRDAAARQEDEALLRYLERYEALHGCCPEPFPGVREILDYLKSRRVCVGLVTGKGPRSAAMTLARFGLGDCFDVVKTGEASGPVKDRRIEEVIAEFSPPREDVLYVGDSPSDVTACRQCGIRSPRPPGRPPPTSRPCEPCVPTTCSRQSRRSSPFSRVSAATDARKPRPRLVN